LLNFNEAISPVWGASARLLKVVFVGFAMARWIARLGRNGQKMPPRRIYGRVCGWRAKHAVSLGHGSELLWPGLEPGRKLTLPLGLHLRYT
jgi:hypothetical protein